METRGSLSNLINVQELAGNISLADMGKSVCKGKQTCINKSSLVACLISVLIFQIHAMTLNDVPHR